MAWLVAASFFDLCVWLLDFPEGFLYQGLKVKSLRRKLGVDGVVNVYQRAQRYEEIIRKNSSVS